MREKEKSVAIPGKTAADKAPRLIALLMAVTILLLTAACGAAEQPADETPSATAGQQTQSTATVIPRETPEAAATATLGREAPEATTTTTPERTAPAPTAARPTSTPIPAPASDQDARAFPVWKVVFVEYDSYRDNYEAALEGLTADEVRRAFERAQFGLSHQEKVVIQVTNPEFYGQGLDGEVGPSIFTYCPSNVRYRSKSCFEHRDMEALHLLAINPNLEVLESILDSYPQLAVPPPNQANVVTPLEMAAAFNPDPGAVTDFLERGAPIGRADQLAAASNPNPEVLATLLEWRGDSLMATERAGEALLHAAARSNSNVEVLELLLDWGVDIEAEERASEGSYGRTPLLWALTSNPNPEIALFLLERGANIELKAGPILSYALLPDPDRLMVQLWKVSPSLEVISKLVELGADTGFEDQYGRTVLHMAVWRSAPETVQYFLDLGLDVHAEDSQGATPLHYAGYSESPGKVELLLAQGAEVDAKDSEGRTPLHWATRDGVLGTVEALLDAGADRKAETPDGEIPCNLARVNYNLEGNKVVGDLCRP